LHPEIRDDRAGIAEQVSHLAGGCIGEAGVPNRPGGEGDAERARAANQANADKIAHPARQVLAHAVRQDIERRMSEARRPHHDAVPLRKTNRWRLFLILGALAVLGDVEAFALLVGGDAQADDQVDDLVEDRRADGAEHEVNSTALSWAMTAGPNS
jgi:hypothetical protein